MTTQVDFSLAVYIVDDDIVCRYRLPSENIATGADFRRNPNALSLLVDHVCLCGTENSDHRYFHFRIFFFSAGTKESIEVDMQPSYTDPNCFMRGVAIVDYKQYPFSNKPGPAPFIRPLTRIAQAAELLKIIFDDYHLNRYIFTNEGQGCRYWCARVLEVLAGRGLLSENVPSDFASCEIRENMVHGSKYPMPTAKGTFY